MQEDPLYLQDLNDLRQYVYETLCSSHDFELGAFETSERILVRGGAPCGIYFCLHGPRSVKITAIWETDRNTILFYGSSGQRLQRTKLKQSPKLAKVAA